MGYPAWPLFCYELVKNISVPWLTATRNILWLTMQQMSGSCRLVDVPIMYICYQQSIDAWNRVVPNLTLVCSTSWSDWMVLSLRLWEMTFWGCRILFGETSDMFHPMLIFLIASVGKKNSAIAWSEESPLVLGKHAEWERTMFLCSWMRDECGCSEQTPSQQKNCK